MAKPPPLQQMKNVCLLITCVHTCKIQDQNYTCVNAFYMLLFAYIKNAYACTYKNPYTLAYTAQRIIFNSKHTLRHQHSRLIELCNIMRRPIPSYFLYSILQTATCDFIFHFISHSINHLFPEFAYDERIDKGQSL